MHDSLKLIKTCVFLTSNTDFHLPVLMNVPTITTQFLWVVYNDYHLKFLWVWLPLIPRCTHTTLFVKFCQWISIDWLVFYVNLNNISAVVAMWLSKGFEKIHKWEAAMRLSSQRICHYVKTYFVLHWTNIYRHKKK